MVLRAYVRNGRLLVDEPTELPDGTELELVAVAASDEEDLDDQERAELLATIDEGLAQARAGQVVDAADFIAELRARR